MNYINIYNNIISKAKDEQRIKNSIVYYEAHHIVPLCMGGGGTNKQWKNHPNIVLLTAREHFLCHLLLSKMYPNNNKIIYAFWMMCHVKNNSQNQRHIPSNRQYNEAKQLFIKIHSKKQPKGTGVKKSKALKGKLKPIGFGENIGNFHRGRKRSDETKHKMSIAKKDKPSNASKPILQYNKQGKFIKEWPSLKEAEDILINPRNIGNCLNNVSKTAGGYKWEFFNKNKICQSSQSI